MVRRRAIAAWPVSIVTHDSQLASWADRIVFIRDGRIIDQTATRSEPESLLARHKK